MMNSQTFKGDSLASRLITESDPAGRFGEGRLLPVPSVGGPLQDRTLALFSRREAVMPRADNRPDGKLPAVKRLTLSLEN